jgi:hypothetical protein
MGHAHHFLSRLDRVSYDEVELSLGLYNNAPLVKYILSRAGLPPGAGRVAISLDDRSEGPFLIVTREGRFVTCLGRGMRCDIPLVRRWQLDVLASRHEELAACMRPAASMEEHERPTTRLLRKLRSVGPNLSREAFLDLSALQPMLFSRYLQMLNQTDDWLHVARHNLRHVARPRPFEHELMENVWNYLWALQHLSALIGVGEPIEYFERSPPEQLAAVTGSIGNRHGAHLCLPASAAGAWLTARFGGAYLPICGHRFEREIASPSVRQYALEIIAVAGARPQLREVVVRAFTGLRPREVPSDAWCDPEERVRYATLAARSLARTDDLDVRAALWGAERLLAKAHPAVARNGWRSVGEVPVEVAMPLAARAFDQHQHDDAAVDRLFHLMPSLARYRAEDFYLPERWQREFHLAWTPEHTMAHLRATREYYTRPTPRVAEKAPGRNDPCTCGSGVKFKKCCAVAPKPAAPKEVAAVVPEERVPTLLDGMQPRARPVVARASEPPPALSPEHARVEDELAAPANDDAAPAAANDDATPAADDARHVA